AFVGLQLGSDWLAIIAGSAAMLGHARPIWLKFSKGGKMVATAGGVSLALAWEAALLCAVLWLVVFLVTKYASLASLAAAVALPIAAFAFGESWPIVGFSTAASVAV